MTGSLHWASVALAVFAAVRAFASESGQDEVVRGCLEEAVCVYFQTLRQADGAYAYPGQDVSHLSATYAAVMTSAMLGRPVPGDAKEMADLVLQDLHPVWSRPRPAARTRWHAATLHEYRLQQIRTLRALGCKTDKFAAEAVRKEAITAYPKAYEEGGNPILVQEVCALLALKACDRAPSATAREKYLSYLRARERTNGSFNTTPADDGSDGHVVNTAYAIAALRALEEKPDGRVAKWIQACQRTDGGFTWSPSPVCSGVSDLWYAWAAIRALEAVGARPADEPALRRWLLSLWNEDGGFAPRPGLRSDPMSTFRAVDVLRALGELKSFRRFVRRRAAVSEPSPDWRSFPIWTIQFEAPGSGSVKEAVQIARELKIHLWGAKNAHQDWIEAAQHEADRLNVPVTFFRSDEIYGKRRNLSGLGNFTHILDPATPPVGAADKSIFRLWQICDHECCARIWLDSGEYDAIGSFHFGCFDMTWLLPFLYQYEGMIPFVANQDSHGEAWWWREELAAYRTVFLAPGRSWDDFREACRRGLVASVRKDAHTQNRLRILGCSDALRKRLVEDVADGQCFGTPDSVSIQVLRPDSRFEVARPKSGQVIRVRVDFRWRESKGLVAPSCRLARASRAGKSIKIERVIVRHKQKDYLCGIIEEAYDLIPLEGDFPQRIELEFEPVDGSGVEAFRKVVDVQPTPHLRR